MSQQRTTTADATEQLSDLRQRIADLSDEVDDMVERAREHGFDHPADPSDEWSGDPSDEPDDRDVETVEERHDARAAELVEAEGERDEFVESLLEWTPPKRLRSKTSGDADDILDRFERDDIDAAEVVNAAKRADVYDDIVDAVVAAGDGIFEIKRMSWGDNNEARDRTAEVSYDYDARGEVSGIPKEGVFKSITLQIAVVDAPSGAPGDPKEYPYAVGEWLYDTVNAYNTRGETDMGNISLRDKLE